MIGSAVGPALGGALLMASGYAGLGLGVAVGGLVAALCFFLMRGHRTMQSAPAQT
jgi:predicted MFS family arabinose efflux permease